MLPADNEIIPSSSANAGCLPLVEGLVLAAMMLIFPAPAAVSTAKAKTWTLLIFAPDPANKDLAKKKPVITALKGGLDQRHVIAVYIVGKSVSAEPAAEPAATSVKLRSHHKIGSNDFRVILLEKGDVKMTSDAPVSADQLFQTIDAVPVTGSNVEAPAEADGTRDFGHKLRSLKPRAEPRM